MEVKLEVKMEAEMEVKMDAPILRPNYTGAQSAYHILSLLDTLSLRNVA